MGTPFAFIKSTRIDLEKMELNTEETIIETAKQSFLFTFKTGNMVLDTVISGIIIMLASYVTTNIGNVARFFSLRGLQEVLFQIIGLTKNQITIKGMITRTADANRAEFSPKFMAIFHHIKKLHLNKSKIHGLKEIELESKQVREYFVDQAMSFTLRPGVYANFDTNEKQVAGYQGKAYTEETCSIVIYSRMKTLQELKDLVQDLEDEYQRSFANQTITLTGRTMRDKFGWSNTFEFSDRFFAVLHKISKIDFGDAATDMLELHLTEPGRTFTRDDGGPEIQESMKRKMSRMVPRRFKFDNDVDGEIFWTEDKEDKSEYTVITNYTIKISSTTKSSKQLSNMITVWEKEYKDFKFSGTGLSYYVYDPPKLAQQPQQGPPPQNAEAYSEFAFESSKSFDNVFFEQKDKIVDRVRFFTDNQSWYQERGIPYTLTFLFHGEPGCGKTSTIKAIANLTQRHIVSVPLKNVKTVEDLYNVFYASTINKKPMPVDRKLFVLEDIDCASLKDTVKKREAEENQSDDDSSSDLSEDDTTKNDDKEKKDKKDKKKKKKKNQGKSKLTLADLLEVFDGVMEMKGRMMVITTNHPDKLDSALIRPGRVDVNLRFGKCRPDDILGIYKNFFDNQDIPKDFKTDRLPNNRWTPAEVVQIFLSEVDSPSRALETICHDEVLRIRISGES